MYTLRISALVLCAMTATMSSVALADDTPVSAIPSTETTNQVAMVAVETPENASETIPADTAEQSSYTIVLDPNGAPSETQSLTIPIGETTELPDFTSPYEGHVFIGWGRTKEDPDCYKVGEKVKSSTQKTFTLYAQWKSEEAEEYAKNNWSKPKNVKIKKGALNTYIKLGKKKTNYLVLATANAFFGKAKNVYAKNSKKSKVVATVPHNSCVVCDMSKMELNKKYSYVKVKLPGTKVKTGYIYVKDFKFGTVNLKTFSLPSSNPNKSARKKVCKYALGKLGTWYSATAASGIDCRKLVKRAYEQIGYNLESDAAVGLLKYGKRVAGEHLQAGDLVFYPSYKNVNSSSAHVAMYIGNGYVVHATTDKFGNKYYPMAGVHISRYCFRIPAGGSANDMFPDAYRNIFGR